MTVGLDEAQVPFGREAEHDLSECDSFHLFPSAPKYAAALL